MQVRIGLAPEQPEALFTTPGVSWLNAASLLRLDSRRIAPAIRAHLEQARQRAAAASEELLLNRSLEFLNQALLAHIGDAAFDKPGLEKVRFILRVIAAQTLRLQRAPATSSSLPRFEPQKEPSVFRYGNVELRVIENYLTRRAELQKVLAELVERADDADRMYQRSQASHYLATDDIDWNLRRLMTNAGFYAPNEPGAAWKVLADWCERYLQALQSSTLSAYQAAYPFYFVIQRILWEASGHIPRYVRTPQVAEVYQMFAGKRVLFLSPLAEQAEQQVKSGRLKRIFTRFELPEFSFRSLTAWMSTWPNRPHTSWSDTFARLCAAIDSIFREEEVDIFLASCGCYGLPICHYVRTQHGCRTLYLGNLAHAFFGIRQRGQSSAWRRGGDSSLWIEGDLAKYRNVERIDRGRYL